MLSTVLAVVDPTVFAWSVVVWLWLTVVFANLAEAVAEGRGKAQAATLRRAKTETMARRLLADGTEEAVPGTALQLGDRVVVEAGEVIPGDGDVVEGVASVDESAITGESAPVIRESGGDRCSVTGGTKVLSDRIVVADHGQARRELHRPDDRPGRGGVAAEDAQRDRAEHPAGEPDDRVPDGHRDAAALRHLLGRRAVADRARRAAGLPDPDHHRGAAVGHRHRRDGPARAAQRAGHVRPGGGGGRRRQHAAAGQDRDHHPRQPAGRRVHRRSRRRRRRARRRRAAVQPGRRDPRGPLHRGPGQDRPRPARTGTGRAGHRPLRPVHRPDPDERRGPRRRPADPQGRSDGGHEVGPRPRRAPVRGRRRHRRRHLHQRAAHRWSSPSAWTDRPPGHWA